MCDRRRCGQSEGGKWGKWGYLRWRAGVLDRTSSQMWDNWNLPIFLLRDGSLTLMYMVSLTVLVMLCDSLPTMEKLSPQDVITSGVGMVIDGGRGPKMFPQPFPKGPYRSLYALLIALQYVTLVPIDYSAFQCDVIPVHGGPPGGS